MPNISRKRCQLCDNQHIQPIINHTDCVLSNRFLKKPDVRDEHRFQLTLGQCQHCALLQLINLPDPKELVSKFDWIVYREPEAHLDALTDRLLELPGINSQSLIAGFTYKDDSLLKRLEYRLDCRAWRIDPLEDLAIVVKNAGSNSILPELTIEKAKKIVEKNGLADIVIARHIFEHAFDTQILLDIFQVLVKPNGYLIIEVPDSERSLSGLNYGMLWEEHALYFTESTFKNAFCKTPFSPVEFISYCYSIENVMLAILRYDNQIQESKPIKSEEFLRAEKYSKDVLSIKKKLHDYLSFRVNNNEKIAVFGAGHVSSIFIDFMEIAPFISYVVDDDPNKIGLHMPGSRLPIIASEKILIENITCCLSGLSPESEEKVINNNKSLFHKKGFFIPIAFLNKLI